MRAYYRSLLMVVMRYEYGRAILLQTDNADAYFNLGVLLQGLGRREQAAEQYRAVLQIQPDFAPARASPAATSRPMSPAPPATTAVIPAHENRSV